MLPWHPEKTSLTVSRDRKGMVRSTLEPSMLCLDRRECSLLTRVVIGTPVYVCDRIGKETGKGTKSCRKTETAAEQNCVFGKNIRLVESNEMYDRHYKWHRVRQMSFGQVSNQLLLGFNHFHIVSILRVPVFTWNKCIRKAGDLTGVH